MRKIIIITNVWLMSLLLVISMTGCAQDTSSVVDPFILSSTGAVCEGVGCVSIGEPADLKVAAGYVIMAKTAIDTIPSSSVTGYIGLSPAARGYYTGWSLITEPVDRYFTSTQVVAPYKLFAADNVGGTSSVDLTPAVLSMEAAYTAATSKPQGADPAHLNLDAGILTGLILSAGNYTWNGATSDVTITGNITLNGSATDIWIFQINGNLTLNTGVSILLTGGALPQNVFWQVAGAAVTVNSSAHFEGIILGSTITYVTFENLSSINGRIFSQTAVNLNAATVTQP